MGAEQNFEMQSDMVRGQINVFYDQYKINRGIKNSIFLNKPNIITLQMSVRALHF